MMEPQKRRREGPGLWITAAYELLVEQGHGAVTIEQLTAKTSKTRGSFYHHFGNMETFIERLMAHWRERNTERIVRLARATPEPTMRRTLVNNEAADLDARVETELRIWGGIQPQVRAACDEVDMCRVNSLAHDLADLAMERGCALSEHDTKLLAQLEYAAFVGAQMLSVQANSASLSELAAAYDHLLMSYFDRLRAKGGNPMQNSD